MPFGKKWWVLVKHSWIDQWNGIDPWCKTRNSARFFQVRIGEVIEISLVWLGQIDVVKPFGRILRIITRHSHVRITIILCKIGENKISEAEKIFKFPMLTMSSFCDAQYLSLFIYLKLKCRIVIFSHLELEMQTNTILQSKSHCRLMAQRLYSSWNFVQNSIALWKRLSVSLF